MDVATGEPVGEGYDVSSGGGAGVALSSRGLMAVVQLWGPVNRRRLGGSFDARTIQDVDSLTFSADGGTLYFSADGDILEMPVGTERVVALVCGRAGRRLTEAECSRYLGDVAYRETCPGTPGR